MGFVAATVGVVSSTLTHITAAAVFIVTVPQHLVAYGNAYLTEGHPVDEPYVLVLSPRYFSQKWSVPFTQERSCWYYAGDEPKSKTKDGRYPIDENTWAFRCNEKFGHVASMRGDESFEDLTRNHRYY